MKFFTTFIFFFFYFNCFSQDLNNTAKVLRTDYSDTYEAIKEFSVRKWETDHSMVLYEINKQSESFFQVFGLMEDNERIFSEALSKWGDNVTNDNILKNSSIDWNMVLYEMKKQIKSKEAY